MPAEGAPQGAPTPAGWSRPGGQRRAWWIVGAAAGAAVVLGAVITIVALTGSDDSAPPSGAALPTDPPAENGPNEVCDPPSWGGEINAEGIGSGRVSLDGVPDHPLFHLTFTYTPGAGQDLFQINTVVDGDEGGFIHRFQEGAISGSDLLRYRYGGDRSATELVINTEGTWTIQIRELLSAPTWPEITEGSTGGAFMRVEPGTLTGPTRGVAEHDGYFSVGVYTDQPPLPGQVPVSEQLVLSPEGGTSDFVLPADSCLVVISADEPWTVTLP